MGKEEENKAEKEPRWAAYDAKSFKAKLRAPPALG